MFTYSPLSEGICELFSVFQSSGERENLKINFNVITSIFQIFEHSIYARVKKRIAPLIFGVRGARGEEKNGMIKARECLRAKE